MKTIDRANIRILNEEMLAAAKAIAEKHGLTVKAKTASYGHSNGTVGFEFTTVSEDGTVNSREAEAFTLMADLIGLKAEWLNTTIVLGGKTMTIVGYNSRARKQPVMLKGEDGKGYKVDCDTVARVKDPVAWLARNGATVRV